MYLHVSQINRNCIDLHYCLVIVLLHVEKRADSSTDSSVDPAEIKLLIKMSTQQIPISNGTLSLLLMISSMWVRMMSRKGGPLGT